MNILFQFSLIVCCISTLSIQKLVAEEAREMKISERIEKVENGIIPAICIEGMPVIKKNLQKEMKDLKVPAVSIAVINDGKIEWTKTYGVISSQTQEPINTETKFQAGSVSKPVAAFGILSLVQEGALDLDEDVNVKLKTWKMPDSEFTRDVKITLRHLLSHTSGLNIIGFDGYTKGTVLPTTAQTLDGVAPANNPALRVEFVPFTKLSYSGGGYCVAQQLLQDVTGITLAKFMQAKVLDPLKMTNSTYETLDNDTSSNIAYSHPINGEPIEGGWKSYSESAAGGLWTTPTDLAKWLIEIQNGVSDDNVDHILSKETLKEMMTPQVVVHGLGPMINGEGDDLEIGHIGRTDGFTCAYVSFPYRKQGAVVMMNAGNQNAFLNDVMRSIAYEYQWPNYSIIYKKTIQLPVETLDKYIGRYGWDEKPNDIYDLFIFQDKNELLLTLGKGTAPHKIYPEKENQFFLLDSGYTLIFEEKNGVITKINLIVQPGFEREFRKF